MIVCIAFIALISMTKFLNEWKIKYHFVFWFESLALFSFGFSWITKAEVIFKENNKKKQMPDLSFS